MTSRESQPATKSYLQLLPPLYTSTSLQGLRFERAIFYSMFSLEDQKEGMKAFSETRKPEWKHN